MPNANSAVLVIDDSYLRASIGPMLRSLGIDSQLFAFTPDFLKSDRPDGFACLVLDVRLPGQSGLDLQRELAAANRELCYTWPSSTACGIGFAGIAAETIKPQPAVTPTKSEPPLALARAFAALAALFALGLLGWRRFRPPFFSLPLTA
jgi:CheY-like chemotaxis protein